MSRPIRRRPLLALVLFASGILFASWSEAAEDAATIYGPYCGVYSFYGAARVLGADVPIRNLFTPRYISAASGSTLHDLTLAAQDHGLYATAFSNLNCAALARSPRPAILHWRKSLEDTILEHFVLYLGTQENKAVILDAPNSIDFMDWGEVMLRWDGAALFISDQPAKRFDRLLIIARSIDYYHVAAILLILLFVLLALKNPILTTSRRPKLLFQSGLVLCFSFGLAVAMHSIRDDGFLAHTNSVELLMDARLPSFLPKVSHEQVAKAQTEDVVLIDARWKADYDSGHIDSAISLEPDLSLADCQSILADVKTDARIILYCQSSGCKYAEKVAKQLHKLGYQRLSIYREGWVDWNSRAIGNMRP